MSGSEFDGASSFAPWLEWALPAVAASFTAAFWAAPLFGVPPAAAAAAATGCFGVCVSMATRELGARRRRAAREVSGTSPPGRLPTAAPDRGPARPEVSPPGPPVGDGRPEDPAGEAAFRLAGPADGEFRPPAAFRQDASDLDLADAAARSSQAILRGIIDVSSDGLKVLDLDGQVTFVSRNGLYLLEFERLEDAVGRDFAALWPVDVRPAVRSAIAASASGASSRFRARCASAKGRPLHLDVVIAPVLGADGRPERLLVVSRDVSKDVEAEEALRRVQDLYRLLAANSSDVVLLREPGPDGAVLYASPSTKRVFGFSPESLTRDGVSPLIHPDDGEALRERLHRLEPDGRVALHTFRLRRADGAVIWIEGAFHLAERVGGATVVMSMRDVTERQQRSEDLAAAKEAAERAQRGAEQASQAKSDFLAAMSHEIRTPLNSIIGFTDLMIDSGDLPDGAVRQAELIRAAGAALLTVVNDVLDFSKAEAGAIEFEAIPFSPESLAEQCAGILRGYAGTKAIDIEVEAEAGLPPWLLGDEARLRQVLLNLLNNAVKFTPRGGRVVLRASSPGAPAPVDGSRSLRFAVSDSGIGIAAAKQGRLFERFSQVDSSVARRFGGSGLGLAICKRLVELMGGTIGVTSREGEGSTFWFAVTLRAASEPAPAAVSEAAPRAARAARILVAEDIDVNQRLAVALLEAAGHAVDVVADGAQAEAAAAATAYDLVLMDIQMPGMDGVTATRRIRAAGGPNARVPIVAMTANVFPEQVAAFREAGMDAHIGKPLNRAQLYAAVNRWAGDGLRPPARPVPPPFDEAVHGQLGSYLGPARLDDVLARLAASLPDRFAPGSDASPSDAERWKADAHLVQSAAGMAGFMALAECCRALQRAAPGTADHAVRLAAARDARDAAVRRIGEMRAAPPMPAGAGDVA